ncbi:unnamed protein product [Vicia faba]|uniref:BZIP domain-containing protein n=1 Tax=Vicia faba TaxID=3906 RepID=A0AAV1B0T7_VICFA|nr:unnamed protein product [Vicia faba]
MASIHGAASSGSDGPIDERKRKRMISNRESARRSRMRKQKQLEDLSDEANMLQTENKRIAEDIKSKEEALVESDAANGVLRARTMELTERLRFLNSILEIAEEVSGLSVEIPEIPDAILNPWRVHHPVQRVMASADVFLH